MEEYLSERQQIDWLRSTLKENAPWALASVVITLGLIVGYQQWQGWRERQSATASQMYEAVLDALARGDADGALRVVKELQESYARTPYSDLAALALARFDVECNKLGEAAGLLEGVVKQTRDEDLAAGATSRASAASRAAGSPPWTSPAGWRRRGTRRRTGRCRPWPSDPAPCTPAGASTQWAA